MDPSSTTVSSMRAPSARDHQRRDARCRDIVDHAIRFQARCNTMAAVEYLKAHDLAAHIIERVLLDPSRRRQHLASPSLP